MQLEREEWQKIWQFYTIDIDFNNFQGTLWNQVWWNTKDQKEKAAASDEAWVEQGQTARDLSEGAKLEPSSVVFH